MIMIGTSPLTGNVYLGRTSKDGSKWLPGKRDITSDFTRCVLEKYGPDSFGPEAKGARSVINVSDGSQYEIIVKKLKPTP